MFKCAHISDVHFRSLKRHDEYRIVFENMFKKLRNLDLDAIFIGGDIVHSKTQGITPELIDILNWWFTSLADIATTHVILGNHDGLILNEDRQDAISPIVNALNNKNIKLYKKSGVYPSFKTTNGKMINWCVFSCFDQNNWDKVKPVKNEINIACYHGAVWGSKTDVDWELDGEVKLDMFNDYDFTFLGDIHKMQYLDKEKRVAYPGSTIQQNYGEDLKKGFLYWEINNRYDFKSKFISIDNPCPMLTIDWKNNLSEMIKFIEPIKENVKYRIRSESEISQTDIKLLHHYLKNDKKAKEIVYQNNANTKTDQTISVDKEKSFNIRNSTDRNYILSNFFPEENKENIELINKYFEKTLDKIPEDLNSQHIKKWSIKNINFENTFSYGKNNYINFEKLNGIVGIFGPNRCGKSSIPGTLMYTLFNSSDRGSIKNSDIVNTRKGSCCSEILISVDAEDYIIKRETNKRTNKKSGVVSATTNLSLNRKNNFESKNESDEQRRETEKVLRQLIGNSDDFLYTSFASQGDINAFVSEKTTARKAVLSKFLGLDIYEELYKASREEFAVLKNKINNIKEENWDLIIEELSSKNIELQSVIEENNKKLSTLRVKEASKRHELEEIKKQTKTHPSGYTLDKATKELEYYKSDLIKIQNEIEETNVRINDTQLNLEKIKSFKNKFSIEGLKSDKVKLDQLSKKLFDFTNDLNKINDEEKRHKSQIKILQEVPCEDKFPNCKFIKNAHEAKIILNSKDFLQTVKDLNDHIYDVKGAIKELEKENIDSKIKKYNDILNKEYRLNIDFTSLNEKVKLLDERLTNKKEEITKFNKLVNELYDFNEFNAEKKIVEINNNLYEISRNITAIEKSIQIEYQDIAHNNANIKKYHDDKSEFIDLKSKWDIFTKFSSAVNKKGIPTMLINSYLPKINNEINKILSGVTNFKIQIDDDDNSNNLNMYIDYGDSKRVIECGSGMEKMMTSIAVRVALTNISNLSRSDMFIIDEGFGALDDTNIEACGRLLQSLKKYFRTILIISHVDAIKDIVDKNLEITFIGKDSYIRYE